MPFDQLPLNDEGSGGNNFEAMLIASREITSHLHYSGSPYLYFTTAAFYGLSEKYGLKRDQVYFPSNAVSTGQLDNFKNIMIMGVQNALIDYLHRESPPKSALDEIIKPQAGVSLATNDVSINIIREGDVGTYDSGPFTFNAALSQMMIEKRRFDLALFTDEGILLCRHDAHCINKNKIYVADKSYIDPPLQLG